MKRKRLPRLWCALQGLLPLEACLAAQRAELAWPPNTRDDGARAVQKPAKAARARSRRAA
mgnify:CR=1 FL=1